MNYEYKRFLWAVMMVTGTCSIGGLALSFNNIHEIITILIVSTALFVPVAVVVVKYKLYMPNKNGNSKNVLLIVIIFAISLIFTKKLSSNVNGAMAVFGFELSALLYFLVRRADKVSR